MSFVDAVIVEEGPRTGDTTSVTLPVATYYLRVYQDLDDSQSVSENDWLCYHMDRTNAGSYQHSFVPYTIEIGHGDSETIYIDLTDGDTTGAVPANMVLVHCSVSYTGSLATVSSSRVIALGIDSAITFDSGSGVGIWLYTAQADAYLIVSAGTWYIGAFFDVDGDHETQPMPETGEPAEVYDNAAFGATGSYTPLTITAGQIVTANITLDDSLVMP